MISYYTAPGGVWTPMPFREPHPEPAVLWSWKRQDDDWLVDRWCEPAAAAGYGGWMHLATIEPHEWRDRRHRRYTKDWYEFERPARYRVHAYSLTWYARTLEQAAKIIEPMRLAANRKARREWENAIAADAIKRLEKHSWVDQLAQG